MLSFRRKIRYIVARQTDVRKRRGHKHGLLLLAAIIGLLFSEHTLAAALPPSPLIFAGSGANLPIMRLLAKAFEQHHPNIKIEVPASIGSTGGIRAAADNAIAAGLISRALRDDEKGLGLTVLPYARTALVIGAHASVADNEITFADFIKIYQGVKTRWQDGQEIIVLTRQSDDSMIGLLEREISGFKAVYAESQRAKRWTTLYSDREMNQALTRMPYAVGLSDTGTITAEQLPIKVLGVNGVLPTADTIRAGSYPLVLTHAFVFLPQKLSAEAKAFLDFVRSPEGERLLQTNGYLPGE
jgi:phosphate transport system substrate-binding protein